MFDVKQLRVLKAVAEHGSFSAAADALSYTQPAISQQIAALEKRAGTTLVDRGSRGVRLTDAGRALVEHAEVVIARLAAAEAELEAIAGIRGGRVRLSSFPTAGASLLPPAVARSAHATPRWSSASSSRSPRRRPRCCAPRSSRSRSCSSTASSTQPEFERLYEGIELHHLDRRPDVPRAAARPPAAARKRAGAARGLRRETWIQETTRTAACGQLPPRGLREAPASSPNVGFRVRRLQRGAGPDRRRRGHLAPARARAHERARGHRRPLARPAGADAPDRRGRPSPAATARPRRTRCSTSWTRWPTASSCRPAPRSPPSRARDSVLGVVAGAVPVDDHDRLVADDPRVVAARAAR